MAVCQADRYRCLAVLVSSYRKAFQFRKLFHVGGAAEGCESSGKSGTTLFAAFGSSYRSVVWLSYSAIHAGFNRVKE